MHCLLRDAEGILSPWRKTLRDRVLSSTTAAAPKYSRTAVAVTLLAVEAALNDVFEHAQVEYFHGHPDSFDVARGKRHDSLTLATAAALSCTTLQVVPT